MCDVPALLSKKITPLDVFVLGFSLGIGLHS